MGFKETNKERQIVVAASAHCDSRLFRNNVGLGYVATGKPVFHANRDVTLPSPRHVRFGLCRGSSDQIGWTPVMITPDMVGKTVAVFTAIEVKAGKNRLSADQENFLNAVSRSGGFGIAGYEPDQVCEMLSHSPCI